MKRNGFGLTRCVGAFSFSRQRGFAAVTSEILRSHLSLGSVSMGSMLTQVS